MSRQLTLLKCGQLIRGELEVLIVVANTNVVSIPGNAVKHEEKKRKAYVAICFSALGIFGAAWRAPLK